MTYNVPERTNPITEQTVRKPAPGTDAMEVPIEMILKTRQQECVSSVI